MKWVPLLLTRELMEGHAIAAKMESRTAEGVAWVWVRPYKDAWVLGKSREESKFEPWQYLVQAFEARLSDIEGEYEINEDLLLHNERHEVATLAEVDELLGELVGDPTKFRRLADWPDYFPF